MSVAQLDVEALQADALLTTKPEPLLVTYWNRLRKHRLAIASLITLGLIILFVTLGPVILSRMTYYNVSQDAIVNYTRDGQDLANRNASPSLEHPMGTDELGRDVLYRLMEAGRLSLFVAFTVVFLSESFGMFLGALSGYYGGSFDAMVQRTTEFVIILPSLPLLLVLSSILREAEIPFLPPEWSQAFVIIAILTILSWTGACRLSRGMVLSLRNQEFTEASRALGMSDTGIVLRHMMPNALPPIIVNASLAIGTVIIVESALSFLGFGIQPPVATWGNMLQGVQRDMFTAPWKALYPGLLIFLTSLSFNFLGDGLRDALDPRLKL